MSLTGEKIYCAARPIIGLSRADIDAEFGKPAVAIAFKPNELTVSASMKFTIPMEVEAITAHPDEQIASYDGPKPGAAYRISVQYLSGVAHEIGITLCGGIPFPEEFIKYWLNGNADASASAYSWKTPPDPLVGVRFWVRKDDALTFVTAEYKLESTGMACASRLSGCMVSS